MTSEETNANCPSAAQVIIAPYDLRTRKLNLEIERIAEALREIKVREATAN